MGRKGMSEQQGQHRQAGLRRKAANSRVQIDPQLPTHPPDMGAAGMGIAAAACVQPSAHERQPGCAPDPSDMGAASMGTTPRSTHVCRARYLPTSTGSEGDN